MADIRVFSTNCSVKDQLINEIKSGITRTAMFNNSLLEIVDTGNSITRILFLVLFFCESVKQYYDLINFMPISKLKVQSVIGWEKIRTAA